ncbi:MAG TPA: T9SS type A sorting domain-containing protein, partial [Segetibacter sp.]
DINQTTTASSYPHALSRFKNRLLFIATDGKADYKAKLWYSDGTNIGTTAIKDTTYPEGDDSLRTLNNNAYFFGSTPTIRVGLFKTDGTSEGTVIVKDFTAINLELYNATILRATSQLIYFKVYNPISKTRELWRSDGSDVGTFSLKTDLVDLNLKTASVGDLLFFQYPGGGGLWKTDGTTAGTTLIKAFQSASDPHDLIGYNGKLYFGAFTGSVDGLWTSDGTSVGTAKVSDDVIGVTNFTPVNDVLYFSATANPATLGSIGYELFKTDGTLSGTKLVKDLTPGSGSSSLNHFIQDKNLLYFFINDNLWKTDGTATGTEFISNIGDGGVAPANVVNADGKLYILRSSGKGLYQSDGTSSGSNAVNDANLSGVSIPSFNNKLLAVGSKVFFMGETYAYGQEIYISVENSVLPLRALKLSGHLSNNNSILEWTLGNEQNSSHFILERSSDGTMFSSVAKIAVKENTNSKQNYTDSKVERLSTDKLYYRVKQVDKDGLSSYSNIVLINLNDLKPSITVAPNPVKDVLHIHSDTNVNNVSISLSDMNGKVIYVTKRNLLASGQVQINVAGLPKGLYTIAVKSSDGLKQVKILKD